MGERKRTLEIMVEVVTIQEPFFREGFVRKSRVLQEKIHCRRQFGMDFFS